MESASERTRSGPIRGMPGLMCVALLVATAGCAPGVPGAVPQGTLDHLRGQAREELARWADVAGEMQGIAIAGELTSQVGDWEEPVGANNKIALMAGLIRPTASLATEVPAPGMVTWVDGTTSTVVLVSAAQALDEIVSSSGGSPCSECRPLEVTGARLASGSVQTSRGDATVPMWEFAIAGTSVKVTRVAVAGATTLGSPPWDPDGTPESVSIDSARGTRASMQLTVSFIGAEFGAAQPCGEDYLAEAVESPLAVVVIVVRKPRAQGASEACRLVGYVRTATVGLASPLADRAVLEIKLGIPVPLLAP